MNFIQKIRQFLEKKANHIEAPEKHCPNCWGRQEYEGQFLEAIRNEQIDLNNIDQKKGWIDAYFTRHFEGIKLRQENDALICSACELSYKPG